LTLAASRFAGKQVDAVLDLLHLMDMAWHDCYGPRKLEVPPAGLDDVLLLADGDLVALISVARAAVIDFRDVRIAADANRTKTHSGRTCEVGRAELPDFVHTRARDGH
jgi:hypothetical protein